MRKEKASDLTVADLPKNRKEVFFDCLKLRATTFIFLGLTLLLFLLPTVVILFLKDNAEQAVLSGLAVDKYSTEEAKALLRSSDNLFNLIGVLGCVIFATGLAGIMRIIRQLVWGEGVFFMQDLFEGIRSNGLHFAVIGLIAGLLVFLESAATFSDKSYGAALTVAKCVTVVLFVPIGQYMLSGTVVYKLGFFKLFKNSAILFMKTVPATLVFLIAFVSPLAVAFISIPLVKYVVIIVLAIVYAPLVITAWFLYSCSVFDRFINKDNFPDLYDRGVYREGKY